ncbi:MAG TPA: hypothetical protein VFZ31_09050 [Vicinamibacterales bacterium]
MPLAIRKIAFAIAALVAGGAAVLLISYATFPYWYAEPGSARYAREHRLESFVLLLGALALAWGAWQCIRRSFGLRWWGIAAGALILFASAGAFMEDRTMPDGALPIGGNWHVVSRSAEGGFESVYHHLYYKQGLRYESIEDLAAEYRFVAPDCVIYRPTTFDTSYAMCGFRSPASNEPDPSMTDAELIALATARPKYRRDWRSQR